MSELRTNTAVVDTRVKARQRMFFPEALARIRCQDSLAEARRHRLIRRFTAGRRWRWLADYAARRADRATERLP